jgi:hypothetical protein
MEIINYSEKAIAVIGADTKQNKEQLAALGGKFNKFLKCGAGWIFSKKHQAKVEAFVNSQPVFDQEAFDTEAYVQAQEEAAYERYNYNYDPFNYN